MSTASNRTEPLPSAPKSLLIGGWIAVVEAVLGLGVGVYLVIHDILGFQDQLAVISGWGTGLMFFLLFGMILAAAISVLKGRRMGRGITVAFNISLVGVAFYMFSSGAWQLGIVTAAVGATQLYMMLNSKSMNWAEDDYNASH